MDIFTALDRTSDYSKTQLQFIIGAWVLSTLAERKTKISTAEGHVEESDYDKRSIYSLLYALYRSMGDVKSETGARYEFTFNTWGYAWPKEWGPNPIAADDPQRFGKAAYTGLYHFAALKEYVREHKGRVHVVEMGCGTGAGADLVCREVLPECTYEAVDLQMAGVQTCRRKFVPKHNGRLVATCADATRLPIKDGVADIVAVCETHVTEVGGQVTAEDERFFRTAHRLLKPGGFLTWGNAIPDSTWQPCFDFLASIGMKLVEVCDVTDNGVQARDEDEGRCDAYVEQCLDAFYGFRVPLLGSKKRLEASQAMKNFYRNPGTRLYDDMKTRRDTYKVALLQKTA